MSRGELDRFAPDADIVNGKRIAYAQLVVEDWKHALIHLSQRLSLICSNWSGLLFVALLTLVLVGCNSDSPDRMRSEIPTGIPVGETVYYNTVWFKCSVAIYKLDPFFTDEVRQKGLIFLNGSTSAPWSETSKLQTTIGSNDRWVVDLVDSLHCIKDRKLERLFTKAKDDGGYYQVHETNSTTLIAPDEGLMMVGGHE